MRRENNNAAERQISPAVARLPEQVAAACRTAVNDDPLDVLCKPVQKTGADIP
jgi:hypothetical protein